MELKNAHLYFISDDFFTKVNDPCLRMNYSKTRRPHYLAVKDKQQPLLYWVIPCSSKIEKYQRLIDKQLALKKPSDTIKICTLRGKKEALLLQDMFPVSDRYLIEPYIKEGEHVHLNDPKIITEIEKSAIKVIALLNRGIKFTPTQPNVQRIKEFMINELSLDKLQAELTTKKDKLNKLGPDRLESQLLKVDIQKLESKIQKILNPEDKAVKPLDLKNKSKGMKL